MEDWISFSKLPHGQEFGYSSSLADIWQVWVFFERRYEYSITGLVRYYLVKVVRILIPTLFFIFLICLLTAPEFLVDHPEVVKDILLLKYDGSIAFDGLGATWFIFTLFWLYLIAPFVCIAFDFIGRFLKNKSGWFVLLATVIIIGF